MIYKKREMYFYLLEMLEHWWIETMRSAQQ